MFESPLYVCETKGRKKELVKRRRRGEETYLSASTKVDYKTDMC